MRPLIWKTLVDQLRFQYGERFDHNSEFKRPHIGNPCIKVLILVIRLRMKSYIGLRVGKSRISGA